MIHLGLWKMLGTSFQGERTFHFLFYSLMKSIRLMNLVKFWLLNQHVIITNNTLNQINNFIRDIHCSISLTALAFEIMDIIRDKTMV